MNKTEFLGKLAGRIRSLPEDDIEKSLEYYSEMIDDYIEDGLSEKEAVERLGSLDSIVSQILSEVSLAKIVKKRVGETKKPSNMIIVLLILGFPVWLPLLVATFSVLLAAYASLWAVVISLWATFGALVGSAFGGLLGGVILSFTQGVHIGLLIASSALVCAGLSIFTFYGCSAATKGSIILTKKMFIGIKNALIKKEAA